ncbi:FAD/NAD(P)-binding domain-containing protein [Hypoxylon trugodes]|uniref:FAD/NAD(P)-binding domain-containing protein n=1 Tax=Hypoxylon trugodes TaxID=326681 RepID=UPI00218F1082|nr:FAD/NAD(P)-binding domain-containing protein [Hypoxylon trugodes]KAI1383397.1 FAD/NAD(P)-binding domain-containing protein [Hypoxylon trugodes]
MSAQAAVSPSQGAVPGSVDIPVAPWPVTATKYEGVDAPAVTSKILESINDSLPKHDHKTIANLFLDNGYWRDHLALTWDFRTMKGRDKIASFLDEGHHLKSIRSDRDYPAKNAGPELAPFRMDGSVQGIQSFLRISTEYGSGPGFIRLIQDDAGEWKIWTIYTTMNELRNYPEPVGRLRANGVTHGVNPNRRNWYDRRQSEFSFETGDPDVLIIGGGQAGLALHARLKMLGVPTLAIDSSESIGDNWRRRYPQLVLHDPVWYDHMPYIEFPKAWPVFTPAAKLANFLKSYAEMLELNVWNNTTIAYSTWDEKKKQWDVVLKQKKDGNTEVRVMHPKHIVQATGHSGKKNYPHFKGMENFKGDTLCHSSEFRGAKKNSEGRKAVVIGACNSALDIAQDFYENGYDVTVIQRSSTTLMSSKAAASMLGALYSEDSPPLEISDVLAWANPGEVNKAIHADFNELQENIDKDIIQGLNKAGFKTNRGPSNGGLFVKYFQCGGGYYIDVGASQPIIEGAIKVKHGVGVSEILPHGVKLEDGTELEADEIVCATGYQNMKTATEAIFGEDVANNISTVWGYDEEGETRVMWRPTGQPGLWIFGGNLAMCRYYSQLVAVQIKAQLEGFSNPIKS